MENLPPSVDVSTRIGVCLIVDVKHWICLRHHGRWSCLLLLVQKVQKRNLTQCRVALSLLRLSLHASHHADRGWVFSCLSEHSPDVFSLVVLSCLLHTCHMLALTDAWASTSQDSSQKSQRIVRSCSRNVEHIVDVPVPLPWSRVSMIETKINYTLTAFLSQCSDGGCTRKQCVH